MSTIRSSMLDVGTRVRALRQARGLSSTALAARADIAVPAISAIEAGAVGLGPARARRLAEALGVRIDDLLRPPSSAARPAG